AETSTPDQPHEAGTSEMSVDLAKPVSEMSDSGPLPVAPPTYVSQPLLGRSIRNIDIGVPVDGSHFPVSGSHGQDPRPPAADRPDDSDDSGDLPMAVGI
ncbi:MAG: hypothetical protein FWD80_02205, partial [Propionibacteriaceae bacterium]|nr:hypothetical protein [Propionibacteriaceae bacterium]